MSLAGKAAAPAYGFEIGAGFAAVEEGDDRVRPGLGLHVGYTDFYASRFHYYGRAYGPVKEETFLASFLRRWAVFKSNELSAGFGAAILNERTRLAFAGEAAAADKTENNGNLGVAAAVSWSLPKTAGPLFGSVSWDVHVFPAGLGGIFLSTGRKQTVTFILGTALR